MVLADDSRREFDFLVLAVPWARVRGLLAEPLLAALPFLSAAEEIPPAAITAVHLWLDRPLGEPHHAVLLDRLSQWVFVGIRTGNNVTIRRLHHCQEDGRQSASDDSRRTARGKTLLLEVLGDLQTIWPQAREAKLLHHRVATQPAAVFALRPGVERLRPAQQTPLENLFLAGDWTATGWPATMEGAVRSGRLAAEAMLRSLGRPCRLVSPDLPRGLFARWLAGNKLKIECRNPFGPGF